MSRTPFHVVIAGGGVAALECVLALRSLAGERVDLTVISPNSDFLHRPLTVGEAFDRSEARTFPLAPIIEDAHGGKLVNDSLAAVEPEEHVAMTAGGKRLHYDALVVAVGAVEREWLPGALTFRGREDVAALREILDDLVSRKASSLALTLPAERMWALPLYELAVMSADHLRNHGSDAEVWVVTPEERPLELFGPAAADALGPMLQNLGIKLRTSCRAARIHGRTLAFAGSGEIHVDRVVTMPQLEGPNMPGLPADPHGFIPVDSHGRVQGLEDVYAAGDVTAFPLKQGGLATQQADAVAETIAAGLDIPIMPKPFTPVLRGLLMTGGAPLYLRAEPHRLPRDASVAVDAKRPRRTHAGASLAAGQPLWWPPAKIAGRYLGALLATARPEPLAWELLKDRVPTPDDSMSEEDYEDALELALMLAECDARWGDYSQALEALDAAQALRGSLPPEYEEKRREWTAELTGS